VPAVRALGPDVLVVSGDHATPSVLAGHGWQPVPVLLWSRYCGADPVGAFTERACAAGTLGTLPAQHLMPLLMANAQRLTKFGA
jgi:2,3-bisphosphoglycerate-independent phosphoglycerate mutase